MAIKAGEPKRRAECFNDMTSPEIKLTTDTPPPLPPKLGLIWKCLIAAVIAVPLGVTLTGMLTSPTRSNYLPTGRIIFLDADQPSERTTTLRGLYLVDGNGKSRELTHENEPQDTDGGQREWINQPTLSPDAHAVAYIKQMITLVDEKQSVDNQLWMLPLQPTNAKPYMLLNLSALKLKQIVGLTWTKDSHSIIFLQDGTKYTVSESEKPTITKMTLPNLPNLRLAQEISATRQPTLLSDGTLAYAADTNDGLQIQIGNTTPSPLAKDVVAWAIRPDGQIAYVATHEPHQIAIQQSSGDNKQTTIPAKWGWSIFGGRTITGLQWSPDGKYIGYTVSKPPVPEDELLVADVTTGKSQLLPFRTGRVAWDWVP